MKVLALAASLPVVAMVASYAGDAHALLNRGDFYERDLYVGGSGNPPLWLIAFPFALIAYLVAVIFNAGKFEKATFWCAMSAPMVVSLFLGSIYATMAVGVTLVFGVQIYGARRPKFDGKKANHSQGGRWFFGSLSVVVFVWSVWDSLGATLSSIDGIDKALSAADSALLYVVWAAIALVIVYGAYSTFSDAIKVFQKSERGLIATALERYGWFNVFMAAFSIGLVIFFLVA